MSKKPDDKKHELVIFKNEGFGEIRALIIESEPWFVGKDVATILGYQNASKALTDHVDPEDKLNNETLSSLGQRGGWLINESGLYSLVMDSKLPDAKKFKRWVTSEVLPAIRRTGSYSTRDASQISIDEARTKRAEATLLNAKTRQANLIWKIASNSSNKLYKQAGEAIAMNMLAGVDVVELPEAEQRPNHELGYFCQFIGKPTQWASALGRKLKQAGINKTADTGVYKVTFDKKNNQRDNFYWFDDFLLPKLAELFPNDYVATV